MTGPGAPRGATPAARALVRVATSSLPPGAGRERYRLEHFGEMHGLPGPHQIRYAVGAVASSWALRQALTKKSAMTSVPARPAVPLLCRLRLHHRWRTEHNEAGEAYRHCTRCGKDAMGDLPRGTPKHPMPFA